jgi:hypothetical protein
LRYTDRQMDKQTDTDGQERWLADRYKTDTQTERKTTKQTDTQKTGRQTDTQTNRQTQPAVTLASK